LLGCGDRVWPPEKISLILHGIVIWEILMSVLSIKSGMIPQRLLYIPMAKAKWTFQKHPKMTQKRVRGYWFL
jgi:hypothetical protein